MKSKIALVTVIALIMAISLPGLAQPKAAGPKAPRVKMSVEKTVSGKVSTWTNDIDYVFDGFYLKSGLKKYSVKFPTQMGSQIRAAVKTGNTITVKGVEVRNPKGEKELKLVSITAAGTQIYDSLNVEPMTKPAEVFVSGEGKISELQKNKKAEVKNIILEDQTILLVPQEIVEQLSHLKVLGAGISYSGQKRILRQGEVFADTYVLIHCQTIKFDGKEYVIY